MPAFLIEILSLLFSSLLAFSFIHFKVSITGLQQIVIAAVIILIFFANRFFSSSKQIGYILYLALIFLISFSLQILVFSSGGFFSPFIVLFHLFAIALSFLVSMRIAGGFVLFAVVALLVASLFDAKLSSVFNGDLASVALYLLSFGVILPLTQVVSERYHLKDALSKILAKELNVQKTIFEGLSDIVIITGVDLKILSFNAAAERGLRLSSSELLGRSLFEVLLLKDTKGNPVNESYLNIDDIVEDKTIRINKDLILYIRNTALPKTVTMQVRPTGNLEGEIDQLAFIITEGESDKEAGKIHQDLQEALLKHEAALEDLKLKLSNKGMFDLQRKTESLGKTEKDILTAMELQDHGLKSSMELKDASNVLSHIVSLEDLFAKALGVKINFTVDPKYIQEAQKLVPAGSQFSPSTITSPYFTMPMDSKWFDLLIQKLLELNVLLVSGTNLPQIDLLLGYDKDFVYINSAISSTITPEDHRLLFTEYYGKLATTTNLSLGSGLEGYMVKTIASLLRIPLNIKNKDNFLIFTLQFSKKPQADTR